MSCVAGRAQVTVSPGDPVRRPVCVRPGTVVSLVLSPRTDGKRWTAVRSSAPALVLVTGRQVAADGTAHVSLRTAGTRGGSAEITVSAKEPDLAGSGGVGFTLDVTVTPYAREG
ncbi:acetyl-CoA synthetase [Streptomyces griseorubiginosus]|uniref:acetyl-CoA synthetase n=1 Tax=Streptomyces griseorubiginosus TaxID=67304 RepID=UPI0036E19CBA